MIISTTIQLNSEESLALSLDDAAAAVLEALQGNPTTDLSTVTVMTPPEVGTAGAVPGFAPIPLMPQPQGGPAGGGANGE